jgi:hypothetical protein
LTSRTFEELKEIMLPNLIKAEVKFTTKRSVSVPYRELESLLSKDPSQYGILAVLFWCKERRVDGRWLISDVNDLGNLNPSQSLSFDLNDLHRTQKSQPKLDDLRDGINKFWFNMVASYFEEAMIGHSELKEELAIRCEAARIEDRLIEATILEAEHRKAIEQIVTQHGPSVSGQIFQVLFAYLFYLLGYRSITINSIGVPDITATGLISDDSEIFVGPMTTDEFENLKKLVSDAGDKKLLQIIDSKLK